MNSRTKACGMYQHIVNGTDWRVEYLIANCIITPAIWNTADKVGA